MDLIPGQMWWWRWTTSWSGASRGRGPGSRRPSQILQAGVHSDGECDDPLHVVGEFTGEQLVLHWLCQPVQEGIHQGPPLPAAVRRQGLEIDGEIRHGVMPLAETQQLPASLQAGVRVVEHPLHLSHKLPRGAQARQVGAPHGGGPVLRPAGQLGDEVGHPRDVSGERLGLEAENQLALGQERPTTSGRPVVPLRGGESRLPVPSVGGSILVGCPPDRRTPGPERSEQPGWGWLLGGRW